MKERLSYAVTESQASGSEIRSAEHPEYLERVYAGVLGKLIGVYLGRPVEGWTAERIAEEIGEVDYYIHDQRGRRLIVTDDDISGTFTFLRALEDFGYDPQLTSEQIGLTWLNYLIERTTILWWGGMGNSTEHTAYLRLKSGIPAPRSGSAQLNSKILSEQIGAQIFIDGWGLVWPGQPARAADFAARAAHVSHDGEAVYGAQVVAAMVSEAFANMDLDHLIDVALQLIPSDSTVSKLISHVRAWHAREKDWRENRLRLQAEYGYDKYLGQCHLIPNHGLIILSLLHGGGDFDESMKIVNTAGWDTDCNSGNVGAILGVRNGLNGLGVRDWRGPVADRLYLPSADAGRAITDAVRETIAVANMGRHMAGADPYEFKDGARFHFSLPGSVQGWQAVDPETLAAENVGGALQLRLTSQAPARAATNTFIDPDAKTMVTGYVLVANPTLYPGHTVTARLTGDGMAASGRLYVTHYNAEDESVTISGPEWSIDGTRSLDLEWLVPSTGGFPIYEIGIELDAGSVRLDRMHWGGVPETELPILPGTMAARAWAKSVDRFEHVRDGYDYLVDNEGIGMLTQGAHDWRDYRVECRFTPKVAESAGVVVRVQGLRRYYALLFGNQGEIRIEKALYQRTVLARTSFPWQPFQDYALEIEVKGPEIRVWIDGRLTLTAVDAHEPLEGGAFGFLVESGCAGAGQPRIMPA